MSREQIGTAPCGTCGHEIPVKANPNGTVNLSCPWCDVSKYVKKGTQAHRIELAKVKLHEQPSPEPKAGKPRPEPEKKADKAAPAAAPKMPWMS